MTKIGFCNIPQKSKKSCLFCAGLRLDAGMMEPFARAAV
jgi:hypothetical protein